MKTKTAFQDYIQKLINLFRVYRSQNTPVSTAVMMTFRQMLLHVCTRSPWTSLINMFQSMTKCSQLRKSVIFFPTNGVGLGHFTRLLAVARRFARFEPDYEIVFFTSASPLHIAEKYGFTSYRIPEMSLLGPDFQFEPTRNFIIQEHLRSVFSLHNPTMFVFDGIYPYTGMLKAISSFPQMVKVWVRRGNLKPTTTSIRTEQAEHFDYIVVPNENGRRSNCEIDFDSSRMVHCNPIIFADDSDLLQGVKVRNMWGMPHNAKLVYVQLGIGKSDKMKSALKLTLDVLLQHENVYAVVAESMLDDRIDVGHDRVIILRDYPYSFYFRAFDFSVVAAGYNSYHEMLYFSIPALCYPNLTTLSDDQLRRALISQENGNMIVLTDINHETITGAVDHMLDDNNLLAMRQAAKRLKFNNGAQEAAEFLRKLLLSR